METNTESLKTLAAAVSFLVLLLGVLPLLSWLLLDVSPPNLGVPYWAIMCWYVFLALLPVVAKLLYWLLVDTDRGK